MNNDLLHASVVLVLRDMVSLLLTIIIKAPELITNADTQPAETSAESIRDFFVEKIIHNCAHPTSPEAMCGHQYNRALVGTDTGSGIVLSLTSTVYVDDHEEKTVVAPSFTSTDHDTRDEAIESIKQLGEVLYVGTLFSFDEDDRNQYTGAPDSGFEYTHIDSSVLEDFSSDRFAAVSREDALASELPLKMDLFRNLIQHKLVYSARKTTVNYYVPLVKSESLFRDIRALDRIHARETIKIAVLYVGPGQWSEAEILSNSFLDTSRSYRSFVDSLGWQVDLATFQGFTGKLESNGSDGESCPYYADESIEVAFHEAAAMPKDQKDVRQTKKKRHIGNDHVHIIWNESHHNYRPETISGDFGNVQIQIRPLEAGEYGIGIYCDEQIKPFGPLCDGTIVSADALPTAVRATAINGHRRAIQAFFRSFTHPYVIRQQTINQIVDKHIDRNW
ncbi:hypothetical protein GGI17_000767 [Coemansia sp. S146]|nr:hypothetical protein GGI17_000767 [Coemansia sp. S146]